MYRLTNEVNGSYASFDSIEALCVYIIRIMEISAFIPKYNEVTYNDAIINSELIATITIKRFYK